MLKIRLTAALAVATIVLAAGTARAQAGGTAGPAPAPKGATADPASVDTLAVYELGQLDTQPRLANRDAVANELSRVFPQELRDAGISGRVTMAAVIGRDGRVEDTRVVGADRPEFGLAADGVVRMMRFRPGKIAGVPVRVRIEMPVTFALQRGP